MKRRAGASYIFTKEYDLEGFIEFASKEGFDFAQLGYEAPLQWIGEVSAARRMGIRALACRLGLELGVHSVTNGVNVAWTNRRLREESIRQIKKAIQFTCDVGAEVITVHPGWKDLFGVRFPDEAFSLAVTAHRELADFAAARRIRIGIENMPSHWLSFCDNLAETKTLLQAVDRENVGLTLDVGHANILGSEALEQYILSLAPKIFLVYMHDNQGREDEHMVIGEGTIDFRTIIGFLAQNGIDVPLSIESHNLEDLAKSKRNFDIFCRAGPE